MKKLLCACLCVIGVACSKTSTSPERNGPAETTPNSSINAKLYPVKFTVGDIEVSNGRIASKVVPVSSYLHYLSYGAYDSLGRLASRIEQDSSGRSHVGLEFGVLKDSLAAGKYTIVIFGAAGNGRPYSNDSDSTLKSLYFQTGSDDFFYKKFTITVGNKDTATSNVKLARITGQLELSLADTLPSSVKQVRMDIDNFGLSYHPFADSVGSLTALAFGFIYLPNEQPLLDRSIDLYGSNIPHRIKLTALNEDGDAVFEKVIPGVFVYTNKRTVLKGILKADKEGAISVSLDTDYEDTIIQNF